MAKDYMKEAKQTAKNVKKVLDKKKWQYQVNSGGSEFSVNLCGEDLPFELDIICDSRSQFLMVGAVIAKKLDLKAQSEFFQALNLCNQYVESRFVYDAEDNAVTYFDKQYFWNGPISEADTEKLIYLVCGNVDNYNDKLVDIAAGKMTCAQLKAWIEKNQ